MQERLVIGISGGHTLSSAALLNHDASWVVCTQGESLNLHTFHYHRVVSRFDALLEGLAERAGLSREDLQSQTDKLVLAVPGAGYRADQDLVRLCLDLSAWHAVDKCEIVDDTWAGLVGGTLGPKGVCAYAGTGASVFVGLGGWEGKPYKIDGWGPILGDFGSGFQLVVDFFRRLGRGHDRGKAMPLFAELEQCVPRIGGIDGAQRWFDFLYILHPDDWRIKFANLAFVITRAADRSPEPDPDAVELVKHSATQMVESIRIATERFPETDALPLVFQGGMFEHCSLYRTTVQEEARRFFKRSIGMAKYRPVVGSALMAFMRGKTCVGSNIAKALSAAIADLPRGDQEILMPCAP